MLEKMSDFFNHRLDGYEAHQLHAIEQADVFYPFTARQLPAQACARVLDLGCGTGLELGYYFALNPTAEITGIDLAGDMLDALRRKFPHKRMNLVQGSYFTVPFGESCYDAVVSVESLHHFTQEQKIPLYQKVYKALVPGGRLILTDYFAESDEQERFFRREWLRLKEEQGICDGEFYHYDTPLTVAHETVRGDKRVNLKEFRRRQGTKALTFASPEELQQILGLTPGAVTPFGLLNDGAGRVHFYIDRDFWQGSGLIGVHPNDNTATVWLQARDLITLLRDRGVAVDIVELG